MICRDPIQAFFALRGKPHLGILHKVTAVLRRGELVSQSSEEYNHKESGDEELVIAMQATYPEMIRGGGVFHFPPIRVLRANSRKTLEMTNCLHR
jgi:hypothetical protein